jgi:uncharacterized protein involved in outer membrane biogenesis
MTSRARNTGIALLAFAALVVAFLAWFDWNLAKPYIERKVLEKTGREFRIHGDLKVRLSLNPLVQADGLTLANADWSTKQPMIEAERVAFRINLWRLLHGELDLPEVSVGQPKVVLERRASGEANWRLAKDPENAGRPPHIGRLTLERGQLSFDDETPDTHIVLDVAMQSGSDVKERLPTAFEARGKFKTLRFAAKGRGGDVISLADDAAPFPIAGTADVGTTRAAVDGTITGIATLSALDLALDLRGDDLSALYPLLGIALVPSPPYRVAGRLVHDGTTWDFREFKGKVGDSDLAGSAVYTRGGERPALKADLVSTKLDLRDLQGFIGPRRGAKATDPAPVKAAKAAATAKERDRVLPDQSFRLDRLRAMDADVKFSGKNVINEDLPVDHLSTHLTVTDGVMKLDPLDFGVAGGAVNSTIVIDGRKDVPSASAKVAFKRLQLPKLIPKLELTKSSVGTLGGQMDLTGQGKSFGALLASANGRFALAMSSGEISNTLLEVVGLDGGEIMKFLFRGDQNVGLRCAVADFDVKHGVMDAQTFVFDTTDTIVYGQGGMNLAEETLAVKLIPKPKDVSILSLRSPIHIEGTLKHPKVRPDKTLFLRAGAAIGLAFVNPLAALIPLIETGGGEDSDCGALLASVHKADQQSKAPPVTRDASSKGGATDGQRARGSPDRRADATPARATAMP